MNPSTQRGFTLIELLVVIAIIGILSAIVLVSLSSARSRGSDAAIKGDLHTVSTQVELYFMSNGSSYGTSGLTNSCSVAGSVFAADTVTARAILAADQMNGPGTITCNNTKTAYAVQAQLVNDTSTYWCVDSTGISKQESSAMLAGATACI
ncbi:MAG TPA: type II secretion system protein [Candidatus Paceibacterota bacterium]|nr:type II secretion system protein [Candidatus Paceibacterota bacterium]